MTTPPCHVLAVNHSEELLGVYHLLLEETGYRVTTQPTAAQDLDGIRADPPDLVILDCVWAGDDAGWAMLELLRADRATARTPIVLCTGAIREVEDQGERLTGQNVRMVLKPFDIDELLGTVAGALGIPVAGTVGAPPPSVVLATGAGAPTPTLSALAADGMRVTTTDLSPGIGDRVQAAGPDVVVVAHRAAERRRAWNALTALRETRALRTLPVVVATDDAEQVERFRANLDRLGVTVVLDPANGALTRAEELVQTMERDEAFRSEVEAAPTVTAKRQLLESRGYQDIDLDEMKAYVESQGGRSSSPIGGRS